MDHWFRRIAAGALDQRLGAFLSPRRADLPDRADGGLRRDRDDKRIELIVSDLGWDEAASERRPDLARKLLQSPGHGAYPLISGLVRATRTDDGGACLQDQPQIAPERPVGDIEVV